MTTTYPMYADVARTEIDQRLRAADDERRRRLARLGDTSYRRGAGARLRHLASR